jgi:carbamoyltransferase
VTVLGISAFYHDAAAGLMRDGVVVAAAQEERFTRKKHARRLPEPRDRTARRTPAGRRPGRGRLLRSPFKFKRLLFSHIAGFPRSWRAFLRSMPSWLHQKLVIPSLIREEPERQPVYMIEHHLSHAASAFLVSPFSRRRC